MSHSRTVGWISWFLCSFYLFYKILVQSTPTIMAQDISAEFNLSNTHIGIISASFFYAYILFQIPAGMLIDRFGVRRILTLACLCFAVGCFAFAFAHNTWVLEASRILMGATASPAVCSALFIASKWLPPKRFAIIAGLTDTIGMMGGACSELIFYHGVQLVGWRTSIAFAAKLGLVLTLLIWIFVRDRPTFTLPPENQERRREKSAFMKGYHALKNSQLWLCGTFGGLLLAVIPVFAAIWCVPYLRSLYAIDQHTATYASSLIFLGEVIGAPLAGWYSDLIKKRRPVMLIGSIGSIITMLTIIYMPNIPLWDMYGLLFALGFFTGSYILSFAIAREITPEIARGSAMAFINTMCVFFGYILLQPLLDWLLNVHQFTLATTVNQNIDLHSYQSAFLCIVIFMILAAVTVFFIKETECDYEEWSSDKTYF